MWAISFFFGSVSCLVIGSLLLLLLRHYCVKAIFTTAHIILKVTFEANTEFVENTKLAFFRFMHWMESLISAT